jgi:cellulase/cellobiase CelA1
LVRTLSIVGIDVGGKVQQKLVKLIKSSNKYPNSEEIGVHCSSFSSSSPPPPASEVPGRNIAVTLEDPSLKQQGRIEACTRLTCTCSQSEEEVEE